MKSLTKSFLLAGAIAAAAPAAWAADGILIHEQTTTAGKTETHQIQIDQHRMRAETTGGAGEKQAMVFDGTRKVMLMINYDKKTYSEMTQADVDRLSGQMTDAMAKMKDQMKNLPPEQRARIEAMMAGRGGMPGTAAKTEYKKTGTARVSKWTCDTYEGSRGGQKTIELCTVSPQLLGFSAEDFAVSRDLQAFFGKLAPQNADNLFRIGSDAEQGFSGVPVRRVTFGPAASTSEVLDVTHQSFPDSTFAVPDGFQKQASPFAGRGRGGQ